MFFFLKNRKGFTIIELIVVITVVGILTGGAALSISSNAKDARNTRRKTDVQQIKSALEFYRSNQPNGFYPTFAQYQTGSNPAFTYPALVPSYMETMPKDPSSTTSNVTNYLYAPLGPGGAACNNTTVFCVTYTLTASLEGGGTYQVTPLSVQ